LWKIWSRSQNKEPQNDTKQVYVTIRPPFLYSEVEYRFIRLCRISTGLYRPSFVRTTPMLLNLLGRGRGKLMTCYIPSVFDFGVENRLVSLYQEFWELRCCRKLKWDCLGMILVYSMEKRRNGEIDAFPRDIRGNEVGRAAEFIQNKKRLNSIVKQSWAFWWRCLIVDEFAWFHYGSKLNAWNKFVFQKCGWTSGLTRSNTFIVFWLFKIL